MPEWLQLNERTDVLASISEVRRQIKRVERDPHAWKWGVIALVSAINSALVCNLSGTMNIGALSDQKKKSNLKQTIVALEHGSLVDVPEPYLAPPLELLTRASSAYNTRHERSGRTLELSQDVKDSFEKLVSFRNEFLHFKPLSWSIEISGFPKIFLNCLTIIEEVAEDGWSFRHAEEDERDQLRSELSFIREALNQIRSA